MAHLLDNPVWNALISGNESLANGDERAKYFPRDVSPFVGLAAITPAGLVALHDLIPFEGTFGVVTPDELTIPALWTVVRHTRVLQLVHDAPAEPVAAQQALVPLREQHVPAMLALTRMTNPGPFFQNTIAFGHYEGIFQGTELVAMAGQRLHPRPYAEISAVCTHPDHLGQGHARQLLLSQIRRIKAAAGIPFLHVRADNARAIAVYKFLGFAVRRELSIYTIQQQHA
ncbi:GNAT family N-acetyltransferase [Hymenobacter terricola]|uniref:GNAT family N-acetyltransferase n=1 Tax=Hymenobacter terricola TaxID=2819236 RepID=UPI001B30901B|nr:GNAT family N-acetyltransferase [Hymenobacter terricola]